MKPIDEAPTIPIHPPLPIGTEITIARPYDLHLHLRDGKILPPVLFASAGIFAGGIVMPNRKPPVTTTAMAIDYRNMILSYLPKGTGFNPMMTLYLTDNTTPAEIRLAKESGVVYGVKYYPAGATTNSDAGVTDIRKSYPALEEMQRLDMPLLIHGEVTDPSVDVFDREKIFIDRILIPLRLDFPGLRIVFEHVTTKDAVDFVMQADDNVFATITAHHLLFNRNAIFEGGLRPHYYCLPVLKRGIPHQQSLIDAATSGNWKFFLGTDSAPHARYTKESACGCGGIYTAESAIELYATVFEREGKIEMLEGFASFHGADFYDVPRCIDDKITLQKVAPYQLDEELRFGEDVNDVIVNFRLNEGLTWKVKG